MDYTYKIGISEAEHDAFVNKSPQTHLLQSSQWAMVKNEWRNERLGFFKNGELVAVASVLIRSLVAFAGFTMIYIPRGPVMDYQDRETVAFVLKSLIDFGRTQRSIFVRFDPFLPLSTQGINAEMQENLSVFAIKDRLIGLGCRWSGRAKTLDATIQPTRNAVLYRETFSEDSLSKGARQTIRTARNKGLEISIGREELLDDFAELLKKTEQRKSIQLRGKRYYQKLLAAYPENSYICLARLDLLARQEHLLKEKRAKAAGNRALGKGKKKINSQNAELQRLNAELAFLTSEIQKGKRLVPLAGTLTIVFGRTSENIYAGMDDAYKHYQPALLTWVETAKQAFERDVVWQNLGGVEPLLDGGLYQFKSRLNPIIEEYIGEFDLVVSPLLYKLFQSLYQIRKIARKKG